MGRDGKPSGFDARVKKYNRAVAAIDEGVARLVKALKASGQFDNTLIVFTSDQGFAWGQHGFQTKWAPYDANLCAPLIFHWPGVIPVGTVCKSPVSGIDIVRTFHTVAGIKPAWKMHGRDFSSLWTTPEGLARISGKADTATASRPDGRPAWDSTPMILTNSKWLYGEDYTAALADKNWKDMRFAGSRDWIMMRKGPYKYIRYTVPDCIEELYNIEDDPEELDNLAVQKKHRKQLLQLRKDAERLLLDYDADFLEFLPEPKLESR